MNFLVQKVETESGQKILVEEKEGTELVSTWDPKNSNSMKMVTLVLMKLNQNQRKSNIQHLMTERQCRNLSLHAIQVVVQIIQMISQL